MSFCGVRPGYELCGFPCDGEERCLGADRAEQRGQSSSKLDGKNTIRFQMLPQISKSSNFQHPTGEPTLST